MIDSVAVLRIDWKGETRDSWTGLGGSCRMPSKLMGAWMLQDWKCGDKQGSQFKEGSPGRAEVVARRRGKASCICVWDAGLQTGCEYRGNVLLFLWHLIHTIYCVSIC